MLLVAYSSRLGANRCWNGVGCSVIKGRGLKVGELKKLGFSSSRGWMEGCRRSLGGCILNEAKATNLDGYRRAHGFQQGVAFHFLFK